MTADRIIFVIDEFFYITGKGTVLSCELLNNIRVGENILITSPDGSSYRVTPITGIDVYRSGIMEETRNAHSGETVGIWVDLLKEKIDKGMRVFKEKEEVLESSEEVNRSLFKEVIAFLDKTSENSVKGKANDLNSQLAKYIILLKTKEEDLIYLDDYGDICFDLWWEECHKFIDRKLLILKLEIIEECRLLLKKNFKQNISLETMEIFDEYLNSIVVTRITNHIDALLNNFEK